MFSSPFWLRTLKRPRMTTASLVQLALLASSAWAQSYINCNPLKSSYCSPNPALGGALYEDFTKGHSNEFNVLSKADCISYSDQGIEFTVAKSGDNPTIESKFYLMFGHVEALVQASPGQGIVSSLVLQSNDLDEVDLEWLGGDTTQVQSNFFSKGDTTTYDRGQFHTVESPQTMFHNYTIVWTDTQTTWYLDGQQIRVLTSDSPSGYPQTPMAIRIGSWAGGDPSNAPGTIMWAGGATDYSKGPFKFLVKSLYAQDFSTGTEYSYGDKTGSWKSIKAKNGKINGNLDNHAGLVHAAAPSSFSSSAVSSSPIRSPSSSLVKSLSLSSSASLSSSSSSSTSKTTSKPNVETSKKAAGSEPQPTGSPEPKVISSSAPSSIRPSSGLSNTTQASAAAPAPSKITASVLASISLVLILSLGLHL